MGSDVEQRPLFTDRDYGSPSPVRNRIVGASMIGFGLVLIISSFLAWAEVSTDGSGELEFERRTATGWDGFDGAVGDGPIFVGLGLIALIIGIAVVAGRPSRNLKLLGVIAGLLALIFAVIEIADIASAESDFERLDSSVMLTTRPGVAALVVAGLVLVITPVLIRLPAD